MFPQADITWALLQPSNLLLLLLLLGFLLLLSGALRSGRRLIGLALLLAVLPAVFPLEEALARPLENRYPPRTPPASVDGLLVLGGAVDWNVSQSRQQLNTNAAAERLMAATMLAERYPGVPLVFTGLYQEVAPNEFRSGSSGLLTGPEFAGRDIVYLGAARSTYEEALLAIRELQPRSGERWLLVTSAWHMPRALATFRTQGWTLEPFPVDYRSSGDLDFRPSLDIAGRLAGFDAVVREWGALLIYQQLGRSQGAL